MSATMSRLFCAITIISVWATSNVSVANAETFSAGLKVSDEVAADETGLRAYPGAKLVTKNDGDGANLQLSFGSYGMKLVVVKLRSTDTPAQVATFYRDDLARFGEVLDCKVPRSEREAKTKPDKFEISCKSETAPKDGFLYRVGVKKSERVVSISPTKNGSEITLVHVSLKHPD